MSTEKGSDSATVGTTNVELLELAKKLKLKHFRGVIMRDEFDKTLKEPFYEECAILNTASSDSSGTHWQAYYKRGDQWYHFCSYGSSPPNELKKYAGGAKILTHDYKIQNWSDSTCGEWCILFLYLMRNRKLRYENIVLFLVDK